MYRDKSLVGARDREVSVCSMDLTDETTYFMKATIGRMNALLLTLKSVV
jgi:hypothetical protein